MEWCERCWMGKVKAGNVVRQMCSGDGALSRMESRGTIKSRES